MNSRPARLKHGGKILPSERHIIEAAVVETPGEFTESQTRALAKVLNRTIQTVKKEVEAARDKFVSHADDYVETHLKVVKKAADSDDPKGWDVAQKGAAWAIEHMSAEGVRIVEKVENKPTGARIMIGVNMGGSNESAPKVGVKVE